MNQVDELLASYAPWAGEHRTWPLTPLELFMWLDDRPAFPLLFQVCLCFDGPLDPAAMREAFRFAQGRQPLLRATIRKRGRGAQWVAAASGWPELAVFAKDAEGEPGLEAIDLTVSPGLHGWMRETDVGWDITLVFHHACCDGQGARMFIQDMVLAYAVLTGVSERADPFFMLDIEHLDRRGSYPPPVGRARSLSWKLQQVAEFFLMRPQPTASDPAAHGTATDGHSGSGRIGFCSHTFSVEDVERLQDPRRRETASLNDVAVAILFASLGEWQRSHGVSPKACVRVTVPTDLRGREDERMPAANRYTYVFLNRRLRDCGSWTSLLDGVQRELQEKLQTRFGVNFLNKIGLVARLPWLMRRVLNGPACFSTALLTNLSDPSRRLRKRLPVDEDRFFWLGKARCHDLQARTPPLRPKTHWGVGIFEYAGRMTVTFRYDTTTITAADAERVLAHYIEGWRQWLAATDAATGGEGAGRPARD